MRAIASIALQEEMARLTERGVSFKTARLAPPENAYSAEWVDILYVPASQVAGVAWGIEPVWFSAGSLEEAYQTFFGTEREA